MPALLAYKPVSVRADHGRASESDQNGYLSSIPAASHRSCAVWPGSSDLAAGVADCVRAVLADNRCLCQRGEEVGGPVEVRHLQVGGADALGVVSVRAGAARHAEAGRQLKS